MEHESFEDSDIASLMNEHFINIKVDREERPDLDSIYMQAIIAMTGHGGWPMTIFLTPDLKPFFGGTYFPPIDRHGMPSFRRVLETISSMYKSRRDDVSKAGNQLLEMLQQQTSSKHQGVDLQPDLLSQAYEQIISAFDEANGGLGSAPKFPQPLIFEFLLRYYARTGNKHALDMVTLTATSMAKGGIYDQIGGGFHRYSTDSTWLTPHFEKMLYDNALLSRFYIHAYQSTGQSEYARVASDTLDYVLREMTSSDGGFYSAQDADSEGSEGKFFTWTPQEINLVLGKEVGDLICGYYGVTDRGNFENSNILHVSKNSAKIAEETEAKSQQFASILKESKVSLMKARSKRIAPACDDKILTSWNGLMLRSLSEAAMVLNNKNYLRAATANANFIIKHLYVNGRLMRSYRNGKASLKGYLEDYSMLIGGLISLYQATFEEKWLQKANEIAEKMISLFWNENEKVFFDTGNDHETLLIRPRTTSDNVMPSGGSAAAEALFHLATLTGNEKYISIATMALDSVSELLSRYPTGFTNWLCALDFYLESPLEIAIIGPRENKDTMELLKTVFEKYLPNKIIAGKQRNTSTEDTELPLLEGKIMVNGKPTAYVCQNYSCKFPVTDSISLAKQLMPYTT
jgi:hypothetical protein